MGDIDRVLAQRPEPSAVRQGRRSGASDDAISMARERPVKSETVSQRALKHNEPSEGLRRLDDL